MDVSQALTDAENSLRDFIASILSRKLGAGWVEKCGVSPERLARWKERKEAEPKRQDAGMVEERLIYYADFYDLPTILQKNWAGEFSQAFGDWKTMDVFLAELAKIRDPDAHRRGLLSHQEHLVLGIAGTIRTLIIRYRSRMETVDDCFPRIENAHDDLGNVWVPGGPISVLTKMKLRPGDKVTFFIVAHDPEDLPLEYAIESGDGIKWQQSPEFSLIVQEQHIRRYFGVRLWIRSPRPYHAQGNVDDLVEFVYTVLPPQP